MYRSFLYITLAFFLSFTFVVKAERAYCAKYEECREARWTDLKQTIFNPQHNASHNVLFAPYFFDISISSPKK